MNKRVAIYGAGSFGAAFYEAAILEGVRCDCFIDSNPQKKEYLSLPVIREEEIEGDITIFVSVLQKSDEICDRLQKMGIKSVFSFAMSLQRFPLVLNLLAKKKYLWMREDKEQMVDRQKLEKVSALLADQKSKDLLCQIEAFRLSFDMRYYPHPDGKEEYFTDEIAALSTLKEGVRFVDAGAYTGDSVGRLCDIGSDIAFVASFEPDPKNVSKLKESLNSAKQKHKNAIFAIYPFGLWSGSDILEFGIDGSSSSGVAKEGGKNVIQIPVCSIDDTLFAVAPNFIKMDIEGAEIEALLGARECIKSYAPILCVCVYHRPSDLWEIPLLIDEILPQGYDMYLRVHEHMGLSTVLYCLPKKGN